MRRYRAPRVHDQCGPAGTPSCGLDPYRARKRGGWRTTADPALVTCRRCFKSTAGAQSTATPLRADAAVASVLSTHEAPTAHGDTMDDDHAYDGTESFNFQVPVTQVVTAEQIAGLLCSGFEGGVGYWCRIMGYREPEEPVRSILGDARICRHLDYPLLRGGVVICRATDGDETDEKYTSLYLDRPAIVRGLSLMASTYPCAWADFIAERYDATTGDVFIQLCLLGDIVYG